ncbi:MAG: hypothetical protein K8I82_19540, partial [Anaerolineae bacterium]|nr:hypothetical protein [Anaerolineae bacterium]
TNYAERPALTTPLSRPEALVNELRQLFERLPQPSIEEDDTAIPEWHLSVETWTEIRTYSQKLRGLCNPNVETPLDERLRPVYGRLHVIALKLALLCAALRWLETDHEQPIVTAQDWQVAEHLAEYLRGSAHRLLEQLDRSGEASREMSLQDRVLKMCGEAGLGGCTVREMCRTFHTLAATTRDAAKELTKAGLLIEQQFGRTERYLLAKYVDQVSPALG